MSSHQGVEVYGLSDDEYAEMIGQASAPGAKLELLRCNVGGGRGIKLADDSPTLQAGAPLGGFLLPCGIVGSADGSGRPLTPMLFHCRASGCRVAHHGGGAFPRKGGPPLLSLLSLSPMNRMRWATCIASRPSFF